MASEQLGVASVVEPLREVREGGKLVGFTRGREFIQVRAQDATLSREAFESELESMRRAAERAGATSDFLRTQQYVRRRLLEDKALSGYQGQDAVLQLLRPFAMRDPTYVKQNVRFQVKDEVTGEARSVPPNDAVAREIAAQYGNSTFVRQRGVVDRTRSDLLQRRRAAGEEAGRRSRTGRKYDVTVDPDDLRTADPGEIDARVVERRRKGSVLDAVRALPARVQKAAGRDVAHEDRRLGTHEGQAADELRAKTAARTKKADFLGPRREDFVKATPGARGRAAPGSMQDYLDRGYAPADAKAMAERAWERAHARRPGSIAWFMARGFSEEKAARLSEVAFEETAGIGARKTRNLTKFKRGGEDEVGSRAFWEKRGLTFKEADALSEVAFKRSYEPFGTPTSEAARIVGRSMWSAASFPFRAIGRAGKAVGRGAQAEYDRLGAGEEGAKKAGKAGAAVARRTVGAVRSAGAETARDYRKARDAAAGVVGEGKTASVAGAGYAAARRTWTIIPGVTLTRAFQRKVTAVADAKLADDPEYRKLTPGAKALAGTKLVAQKVGARLLRWYGNLSLAAKMFVLVGIVVLAVTMPVSTAKYGVHVGYMSTLAAVDYGLLAEFNAVLQLLWFFYDIVVNFILNIVIHGVLGVANDYLMEPLLAALNGSIGLDMDLVRPTFKYAGTAVPQVAYLTTMAKSDSIFPEVVPMDAYGNLQVGTDAKESAGNYVTYLPPSTARDPDSAEWNEWMLGRLENATGCLPRRQACFDTWGFDIDTGGKLRFDFDRGPALFPNLIVPPNFDVTLGSLLPTVHWYVWFDDDDNRIEPGELRDQDSFLAAVAESGRATTDSATFDLSDSLLGRLLDRIDLDTTLLGEWVASIECRVNFEGEEQDACLAEVGGP